MSPTSHQEFRVNIRCHLFRCYNWGSVRVECYCFSCFRVFAPLIVCDWSEVFVGLKLVVVAVVTSIKCVIVPCCIDI